LPIIVGTPIAPEVVVGMNGCDKRLLKIVKIRLPSDGGISRTKTGKQIRLSIGLGDQGVQQMPCKIPFKYVHH
jgi:hypothetical protein